MQSDCGRAEVPTVKFVTQFTKPEEAKAWPVLLQAVRPVTVLPNRTYVLDEEARRAPLGRASASISAQIVL